MKLDLKGFQKISKNGNLTKLRHPSGHEISINHSILSPKMRGEIEAIPHVDKQDHPDSKLKPKFADGGYNNPSIPEPVVEQSEIAFKKPKLKPTPEPTREERYTKIREDAAQQFGHSSAGYAEGGDVVPENIKIEGEQVDVPVSRTEAKYAEEENAVNKVLDADPKVQLEDQANGATEPVVSQPVDDIKPDPAQRMLDAHNSAMDSHNIAMKLFAAAQPQQSQPQSNPIAIQPSSNQQQTQSQPSNSQNTPEQPTQTESAPSVQSQQNNEQPAVDNSYQGQVNQASQSVQDLKSYIDKQESANEKLGQAVLTDKINPSRLYQNTGTGGKISSVIGLILGGIGAGASDGKNLAVEAMQKAIDTDVDAQKANQSNKINLYRMNLEATKNDVEARSLTSNQLMSAAQAQLAKRAADTQNVNGQLQAQEAIQKIQALKMENAQNAYKYKIMQELGSGPKPAPGSIDMDKFNKLQMAGVLPKEDVNAATKEARDYQEKLELQHNMEDSAKHLEKQVGHGLLTPGDRQSATQAFAGRIAKLAEGRFNLQESELQAKALLPQPGDLPSTLRNKEVRRKQFFDSMAPTPTLERYGLVSKQSTPIIKKMGGVSYQLGPDGNYHKLGK